MSLAGTVVVIVGALIIAAIYYRDRSRREKDSSVLVSGPELSWRELFLTVLTDLSQRRQDSFCTFGPERDENVWFQVTGATNSLCCGNLSWPKSGDLAAGLGKLGIPVPANLEVTLDEPLESTRTVMFNCDDLTVEQWADLIQAVFRQVHDLSPDDPIKGWVTRC